MITIDGATGEVMLGEVPTVQPELVGDFGTLMAWADAKRRLRVRANAETPLDCRTAREFGAEGIGLCRTEHMFFDSERIMNVRRMILAEDEAGRRAALADLLPAQRADFAEIFRIMAGLPVTIRLLDPPLHEFLPHEDERDRRGRRGGRSRRSTCSSAGSPSCTNSIRCSAIAAAGSASPIPKSTRCRPAPSSRRRSRSEEAPIPEVMVPLVATRAELAIIRALIDRTAEAVFAEKGARVDYLVGTMIELPRAALAAGAIAEEAEFFSFGTNDLTQTALGVSRDDAGRFLTAYVEKGIFARDPFVSIDVEGVGELIAIAAERGRAARPGLKLGICGEHGGDPASIAFCEATGLDYVSARPIASRSPGSRRRRRRSGPADRRTMMRRILFAAAVGLFLAAAPAIGARAPARVTLAPCRLPGVDEELRCGVHRVPENRATGRGRMLPLKIVVLPARRPNPALGPIFYLSGGPGETATESVEGFAGAPEREEMDMVFVDQRGTGEGHFLGCPPPAGSDDNPENYLKGPFDLPNVRACRDRLAQSFDLSRYGTAAWIEDLDEVRRALGYRRINLSAGSFGTYAAQRYMRRYGRHVRAAYLLSPVILANRTPLYMPRDGQAALERRFAQCEDDAACRADHPRFRADFAAALARLRQGPVEAGIRHPGDGGANDGAVDRGGLRRCGARVPLPQRDGAATSSPHRAGGGRRLWRVRRRRRARGARFLRRRPDGRRPGGHLQRVRQPDQRR